MKTLLFVSYCLWVLSPACSEPDPAPDTLEEACAVVATRVCDVTEACGAGREGSFRWYYDCVDFEFTLCTLTADPRLAWDTCEFTCENVEEGNWQETPCLEILDKPPSPL